MVASLLGLVACADDGGGALPEPDDGAGDGEIVALDTGDTGADSVADADDADDAGDTAGADGDVDGDADGSVTPVRCAKNPDVCAQDAYCDLGTGLCTPVEPHCTAQGWCCIPAAIFMMGSDGDRGYPRQQLPRRRVTLTHAFWMQTYEVRLDEWVELMGDIPPGHFVACGPDCPAHGGTAEAKFAYANAASLRDGLEPCYELEGCEGEGALLTCDLIRSRGLECRGYRLPSEAEREFAARAGRNTCIDTTQPGPFGDIEVWTDYSCTPAAFIPEVAAHEWYCVNAEVDYASPLNCHARPAVGDEPRCGPHPVGMRLPNAFGLHDMGSNVEELIATIFTQEADGPATDPGHPAEIRSEDFITMHGGHAWMKGAIGTCPNNRPGFNMSFVGHYEGFRLVQTIFDEVD